MVNLNVALREAPGNAWLARLDQEMRLKRITFSGVQVLLAMWHLINQGECMPSEQRLMSETGVSSQIIPLT